jgi:hypothetical protein
LFPYNNKYLTDKRRGKSIICQSLLKNGYSSFTALAGFASEKKETPFFEPNGVSYLRLALLFSPSIAFFFFSIVAYYYTTYRKKENATEGPTGVAKKFGNT